MLLLLLLLLLNARVLARARSCAVGVFSGPEAER